MWQKTNKRKVDNNARDKIKVQRLFFIFVTIIIIGSIIFYAFFAQSKSFYNYVTQTIECNNPNENAQVIFDQLLQKTDLNQVQIAGIVGNLRHESANTFSPFIHEYTQDFEKGGWGIAQWTGYRRDNGFDTEFIGVVAYVRREISEETFAQYYRNYGRIGYDCTPDGVPDEVNLQFLSAEIDFLVRELTYRPLGFYTTYNKLKNAQTVDEASDIWLTYYEGPSDLESVIDIRRNYSREIYEKYANHI